MHHPVYTDVGVDQDCPLCAVMFAVAMRDPDEKVLEYARSLDPNAGFYLYLDDCYILASPNAIHRILDFAANASAEIGLEINPAKKQVWCHAADALPQALRQYYTENFRVLKPALQAPGDVEHQGATVKREGGNLDQEVQSLTSRLCGLVKSGLDR